MTAELQFPIDTGNPRRAGRRNGLYSGRNGLYSEGGRASLALIKSLKSADEFHLLTTTSSPLFSSHALKSFRWVVLPDPSIPSKAINRPGSYSSLNTIFSRDAELVPNAHGFI